MYVYSQQAIFFITVRAMKVINDLMTDIFSKLSSEAKILAKISKRKTLTTADVQTAIKLIFPKDIAQFATQYRNKAVSNFNTCCQIKKEKDTQYFGCSDGRSPDTAKRPGKVC